MGPKDIFRLQKGSNDDRAIIAKYCLMDCQLVIDLLNKLQVIPNNMVWAMFVMYPYHLSFFVDKELKLKV